MSRPSHIASALLAALLLAACAACAESCPKMRENAAVDESSSIVVKGADGAPVAKLCPGRPYTVQISFSAPREYLLATTKGAWPGAACPSVVTSSNAISSAPLTLALGCASAGQTVTLTLASRASAPEPYAARSVTLPIGTPGSASCPRSPCQLTVANASSPGAAAAQKAAALAPALPRALLSALPEPLRDLGNVLVLDANQSLALNLTALARLAAQAPQLTINTTALPAPITINLGPFSEIAHRLHLDDKAAAWWKKQPVLHWGYFKQALDQGEPLYSDEDGGALSQLLSGFGW